MADMNIFNELVQNATISADDVAIGFRGTNADRTQAIVRRALEALEANGMITVVPVEQWPPFYTPFPPYTGLSGWRDGKGKLH